jgi:DnaJ-class molecular chaperone
MMNISTDIDVDTMFASAISGNDTLFKCMGIQDYKSYIDKKDSYNIIKTSFDRLLTSIKKCSICGGSGKYLYHTGHLEFMSKCDTCTGRGKPGEKAIELVDGRLIIRRIKA